MARRQLQPQMEHDSVIAAREAQWRAYGPCSQTWTNPDGEHNTSFNDVNGERHPDIIVKLEDSKGVRYGLEEVETADSVNADEVSQWRDYAASRPSFLNLVVPAEKVADAKKLGKGIATLVVGYTKNASGYAFAEGQAPWCSSGSKVIAGGAL
jgi:hypothetical protein